MWFESIAIDRAHPPARTASRGCTSLHAYNFDFTPTFL